MNADLWSDAVRTVMDVLWRASWQGAAGVLLVLVAQWILGKRVPARWRYNLWLIVLVRLALPVTPSSAWSVFNWVPGAWGNATPQAAVMAPAVVPADDPEWFRLIVPPPADVSEPAIITNQTLATAPTAVEPAAAFAWHYLLAAVWLIGVLVLSARVAWASIGLQLAVRRMRVVDDWTVLDVLDRAAQEIGVTRELRVLVAPNISTPALMGVLRPKLLLPPAVLSGFDPAELRLIFLHELAHLRRNDVLVNWIMTLLLIVHWFNPMVWLAMSRIRSERELACDQRVLGLSRELVRERRTYGLTILKLLESFSDTRGVPGMVGILEGGQPLKRRIAMIAHFERPGRWWASGALVSMIAIGCVALTDSKKDQPAVASSETADVSGANRSEPTEVQTTVVVPDGGYVLTGPTTQPAPIKTAKANQLEYVKRRTIAATQPAAKPKHRDVIHDAAGRVIEKPSPGWTITADAHLAIEELEHRITQAKHEAKVYEMQAQKHENSEPPRVADAQIAYEHRKAKLAEIEGLKARLDALHASQAQPVKLSRGTLALSGPKDERVDQTMAKLRQRLPEVKFDELPITSLLDFIRDVTDMNLVLDTKAMEAAGIAENAPVTLRAKDLTAEELLEHAGRQVGGGTVRMGIMIEGNVVTFTTAEEAAKKTIIRAYDVGDLVAGATTRPSPEGQQAALADLVELISETVDPDSWRERGGTSGSISTFGNTLVVKTTPPTQMDVEKLLGELRGARRGGGGGFSINETLDQNLSRPGWRGVVISGDSLTINTATTQSATMPLTELRTTGQVHIRSDGPGTTPSTRSTQPSGTR